MEGSAVMSVVEHFVERLWAGILAKPLTPSQVEEILDLREFVLEHQGGHMGNFASKNIQGCCEIKNSEPNWGSLYWDNLNAQAQKAAQLLGFNEEIWDGDDDNVPIYSTPFDELTEEKIEAVLYLGLRSYFAGWKANQCEEGEKESTYLMSYPDVKGQKIKRIVFVPKTG